MTLRPAIVFDLKLAPAQNVEVFCPDFSRNFSKADTLAKKRADWLAEDWVHTPAATSVQAILTTSDNITADTVLPASAVQLIKFVDALTSGTYAVICEHFNTKAAILLIALTRLVVEADKQVEVAAAIAKLYAMRRRQIDLVFPHLDSSSFNDGADFVHNPIRALKLDDLSHAGLCAVAELPNNATRLTVQRKLAHRVGIIQG